MNTHENLSKLGTLEDRHPPVIIQFVFKPSNKGDKQDEEDNVVITAEGNRSLFR
jgi:hypothetical protein